MNYNQVKHFSKSPNNKNHTQLKFTSENPVQPSYKSPFLSIDHNKFAHPLQSPSSIKQQVQKSEIK
jgi:hypothetical protein